MKRLIFISAMFVICIINDSQTLSQSGRYLTKEGESLWNISILCFESGEYWFAIWDANKKIMPDPNVVPAGVYLKIPELPNSIIQEGKGKNKFKESLVNLEVKTDCQYFPSTKSLECTNKSKYIWHFDEYKSKISVDWIPEYEKLIDPFSYEELYEVENIVDGTITDKSGIERSAAIWFVNDNNIKYIAISTESYASSGNTLFSSGFILMQFKDGYQKVFSIFSQESL